MMTIAPSAKGVSIQSAPTPEASCASHGLLLLTCRGRDKLDGGDGVDFLEGGLGADELDGGDQSDRLSGGDDADTLRGADGNDRIVGGLDGDRLVGGNGNDLIDGGDGRNRYCDTGRDTVRADSTDRVIGCERVFRLRLIKKG